MINLFQNSPRLAPAFTPSFSPGDWLPTLTRLTTRGAVALTLDDGPTPRTTAAILRLLAEHAAPATFFVSGERAAAQPQFIEAIVKRGHDVYASGWSHIQLQHEQPEGLSAELSRTEALLSCYRPTPTPYLVRPPFASAARDPAFHRSIRAWNPAAQLALWSHNARDHLIAGEEKTLAAVAGRCDLELDRMMASGPLGGAILQLHEKPFGVASPLNADVAPLMLEKLLHRIAKAGLRVDRLTPRPAPSRLSRYVLTASV